MCNTSFCVNYHFILDWFKNEFPKKKVQTEEDLTDLDSVNDDPFFVEDPCRRQFCCPNRDDRSRLPEYNSEERPFRIPKSPQHSRISPNPRIDQKSSSPRNLDFRRREVEPSVDEQKAELIVLSKQAERSSKIEDEKLAFQKFILQELEADEKVSEIFDDQMKLPLLLSELERELERFERRHVLWYDAALDMVTNYRGEALQEKFLII